MEEIRAVTEVTVKEGGLYVNLCIDKSCRWELFNVI